MRLPRTLVPRLACVAAPLLVAACNPFPDESESSAFFNPQSAVVGTVETTVGRPVSPTILQPLSGGGGSYTFAASGLPDGLSLTPAGTLAGTPTVAVTRTATISVTDKNGTTKTVNIPFKINAVPKATLDPALQAGRACTAQAACVFPTITLSDGTGALTAALSPAIAGLTLTVNGFSASITGTPSVPLPRTTVTLRVTDAQGAADSVQFAITVNAGIVFAKGDSTPVCTVGVMCRFTPWTASGGTNPLRYRRSANPLLQPPVWLVQDSLTGSFSGMPPAALVGANFETVVFDAAGASASRLFTPRISSAVVAQTARAVRTTAGVTLSLSDNVRPVTASGGTGPLTYRLVPPPSLPPGLSLTSDGVLTGTPTAPAAAISYTVLATDVIESSATATFGLQVNAPIATTAIPVECTEGVPCVVTPVTATLGTPTAVRPPGQTGYRFTATEALPLGLAVDSSTGQIRGTPTQSQTSKQYPMLVTDSVGATATQAFTLQVVAQPRALQAERQASTPVTSGVPFAVQPIIQLVDANGQLTRGSAPVTVTVQSGAATLRGDTTVNAVAGRATFTNLQLNGSGPVTLRFRSGTLTTTDMLVTVAPPAAAVPRLRVFRQPPARNQTRIVLDTQPVVHVVDEAGQIVTSSTVTVIAEIETVEGTADLDGAKTVTAVGGVATFTNLVINGSGRHRLRFRATSATPVSSSEVRLTPGPAARLEVLGIAPVADGEAFDVTLRVQDFDGILVTSSTAPIEVTVAGATFAGSSGAAQVNAENGVARFRGLVVENVAGDSITLTFTSPDLPAVPIRVPLRVPEPPPPPARPPRTPPSVPPVASRASSPLRQ